MTNCKYLDISQYAPLATPIDFDRELVIRDLSVVEDPCRTTNHPVVGCSPSEIGVWTFGRLMKHMSGNTPPEQFVAEWLDTFENPQSVNGFPVPPRGNIRSQLIDPWLVASGCHAGDPIVGPGACALDLSISPLLLSAVVNRVDLSGPSYGADNPGEARFVFTMVRLQVNTGPKVDPAKEREVYLKRVAENGGQIVGGSLKGTVILEYRIPRDQKIQDWTQSWHKLSDIPLGTPDFNNHLQSLTDIFSSQGADMKQPNLGSSIGQVRTNEISLGNDGIWEMREFTLQDVGLGWDQFGLRNDTTKQTPDDSMNNDPALDAWMLANEPLIMDVDHVVPNGFMGGISRETFFVWEPGVVPPMDPLAHHHFSLTTCNGCHTNATSTGFTHVDPRSVGSVSNLSGFLGVSPAPDAANDGLPNTVFTTPDELTGAAREYNEPWRRVCEVARILNNDPDPYTRQNGGVH
ncbi:MAG: hypothetical protein QM820_30490 [Minicystis sp.]